MHMNETFEEAQASTNHEHDVLAEAEAKLARLEKLNALVEDYGRAVRQASDIDGARQRLLQYILSQVYHD